MSNADARDRVMRKIERISTSFQQVLKSGIRPTFFLPDQDDDGELLELNTRNAHHFLYVAQLMVDVYMMMESNTYRTKRDLYYEHKAIFGEQRALDNTVNFLTHLLRETRFTLHIMASSKGLVIGDLSFKVPPTEEDSGGEVDCRDAPVPIPMLPMEVSDIKSNAAFILIAEKDATFQCFVDENSQAKLGNCILLTAKGYPDYATRVFLHRLHSELELPVYALMDADPYGIEIYMIYKYGSMLPRQYDVFDIALPSLIWIGVYPTEASKLPLEETAKLPLTEREYDKAEHLQLRALSLNENFVIQQLNHIIEVGYKIEIEAVAALGQCFLTERYLKAKLCAIVDEE